MSKKACLPTCIYWVQADIKSKSTKLGDLSSHVFFLTHIYGKSKNAAICSYYFNTSPPVQFNFPPLAPLLHCNVIAIEVGRQAKWSTSGLARVIDLAWSHDLALSFKNFRHKPAKKANWLRAFNNFPVDWRVPHQRPHLQQPAKSFSSS